MTLEAAIDNDVLIKAAAYDLLEAVAVNTVAKIASIGVLGAARYVCRDAIRKKPIRGDRVLVQDRLSAFLDTVESIEPTGAEIALAAEFEEAALRSSLSLDSGESQLAAVAVSRDLHAFVTGDKRAISALARVIDGTSHADKLAGKVRCFEQTMLHIAEALGCIDMRTRICGQPDIDRTMAICFSCASNNPATIECEACLKSYIASARATSAALLAPIG